MMPLSPPMLETVRGDHPLNLPPPPAMPPGMASVSPGRGASTPGLHPATPNSISPMQSGYPQLGAPAGSNASQPFPQHLALAAHPRGSLKWIWWIIGLLALGAVAGAVLALMMK
jgi:hypothetical protein